MRKLQSRRDRSHISLFEWIRIGGIWRSFRQAVFEAANQSTDLSMEK
jgi:hypothetical protein